MNDFYNDITSSVIMRAIDDYKLLKQVGASYVIVDGGYRLYKSEIENFFNSEWCDFLLSNMNLTGKDILEYLDRE